MTFEGRMFSVDLVDVTGPDDRAKAIIDALPEAVRQLGKRPTHVQIGSDLRINIEMLEGAGIRVHRRKLSWVSRYLARLAVEEQVVDIEVAGGPRRLTVGHWR